MAVSTKRQLAILVRADIFHAFAPHSTDGDRVFVDQNDIVSISILLLLSSKADNEASAASLGSVNQTTTFEPVDVFVGFGTNVVSDEGSMMGECKKTGERTYALPPTTSVLSGWSKIDVTLESRSYIRVNMILAEAVGAKVGGVPLV